MRDSLVLGFKNCWIRAALCRVLTVAIGQFFGSLPIARSVVDRFLGGEELDDALEKAYRLADDGFHVSLAPIDQSFDALRVTIEAIQAMQMQATTELSVQMDALGESERERRSAVFRLAEAAVEVGITLECERSSDEEIEVVVENAKTHPHLGVTLAANLRRSEAECRRLAAMGTRVRLVKGAHEPNEDEGFVSKAEVDKAFVRCMKVLMAGDAYPMIATHDERMIEIARALATRNQRSQGRYEFDFYLGVNPQMAQRLLESGETVRLTLPFGEGWYAHFLDRVATRPASLGLFFKGITGG